MTGPRLWIALAILLGALVAAPIGQGNYFIYVLCSWLIWTISAMGLNLTVGYAGQISLAQASFMAIGAYITALLTLAGWHWLIATPLSMLACFTIGILLGFPALRVQGHFLAFVTLAFNTLVYLLLRNEDWLTGGSYGLVGMPRPNFGWVDTARQGHFYYFTLTVTVLAALGMWGIIRSPWGRAFKALRENPIRAESLGIDTRRLTLLAFAIGSAYAGLAGALITPLVQFIEPGSFSLIHSLRVLLMVVVGGLGAFFGPLLGAGVVILLPEFLRFAEGYYLMIYAVLVVVLMIFCPSGLVGVWGRVRDRFSARKVRGDLVKDPQP